MIFSQRGHEVIAIGAAYALQEDDIVASMHRDLGAYLLRGMSPGGVFAQAMARIGSPSRGRDVNTHGLGDLLHCAAGKRLTPSPVSMPRTISPTVAHAAKRISRLPPHYNDAFLPGQTSPHIRSRYNIRAR